MYNEGLPFLSLTPFIDQGWLASHIVSNGKLQSGDCMIGAEVSLAKSVQKAFSQSSVRLVASFGRRLHNILDMAEKFCINFL